jgi:cation transport ATPase
MVMLTSDNDRMAQAIARELGINEIYADLKPEDKVAKVRELGQRNRSMVNQSLALSAVVIGALVIGAVSGAFSLPVAVIGHELSEFVVIGSAPRMLKA